jgi:type IV pilus assembly protein PilA
MRCAQARGFTILELMTVVAVIGILAAIAFPTYLASVPRAQAAEGVGLLSGARTSFAEAYSNAKAWPASVADVMQVTSGKYTASIGVFGTPDNAEPGAISLMATMSVLGTAPEIRGATILLSTSNGGTTWVCASGGSRPIAAEYLPPSCR